MKGIFAAVLLIVLLVSCSPQPVQQPSVPAQPAAQPSSVQNAVSSQVAPSTTSSVVKVNIQNFAFHPSDISIKAGTTVSWTNLDRAAHTATGDNFDTGTINPGQSKSLVFKNPGVYEYSCSIHPSMKGSIRVV